MAVILALICAMLGLAACGGAGGARATSGGGTHTIVDATGHRVAVPDDPKRVVVLSEPTLDGALALGIKPIATTDGRGQDGISLYLQSRTHGIKSIGLLGQPNLEALVELHPGLILIDGTATQDGSLIGKLREIAPTVYVSRTGENWQTAFLAEGRALDRLSQAKAVLAAYDHRVKAIRAELGTNAGVSVSVVRWSGIGFPSVIPAGLATGRTLAALGLRRLGVQAEHGPGHGIPVSTENLSQINADWMFFASLGNGGPSGGAKAGSVGIAASRRAYGLALSTPGFKQLPVVKEHHVVFVDGSAWTSAGGPIAENLVLTGVQRALTGHGG